MNFEIVNKKAFSIVGKGILVSTLNDEDRRKIPEFWEESNRNGFVQELVKISGSMGLLGACIKVDPKFDGFTYVIGVEKNSEEFPAEWEEHIIPAGNWAIFEVVGPLPDSIQMMWERIYREWLPSSGYKHANAPYIEVYLEGDTTAKDYVCQIWIPVIKK